MKFYPALFALFASVALLSCGKSSAGSSSTSAASDSSTSVAAPASDTAATPASTASAETTTPAAVAATAPPAADAASPAANFITSFTVYNSGGTQVSNQPITMDVPLATGDVPAGHKIQIRANDGVTVLTTQEDTCSKWSQDSS